MYNWCTDAQITNLFSPCKSSGCFTQNRVLLLLYLGVKRKNSKPFPVNQCVTQHLLCSEQKLPFYNVARNKSVNCAVAASSITAYHSLLITMPRQYRTRHCLAACLLQQPLLCTTAIMLAYQNIIMPRSCRATTQLQQQQAPAGVLKRFEGKEIELLPTYMTKLVKIKITIVIVEEVQLEAVFHNNENGPFTSRIYSLAINIRPNHCPWSRPPRTFRPNNLVLR